MPSLSRRSFTTLLGGSLAASAVDSFPAHALLPSSDSEDFDFIFFTDTHLEPERNGAKGCAMAFKHMRGIKADFAVQGGDHIFDALQVPKERSLGLFDLYDKTQQDLSLKVYHTLGNHDCVGVYANSGVALDDPLFGKKYFEEHLGKTFYSFDHKGVHFVVLDSIGITPDRGYEGRIDAAQLQWLGNDLHTLPAGRPIVVVTHIPLVTAIENYEAAPVTPPVHHGLSVANSSEVIKVFAGRNVVGVLQGHKHVNERVEWHGVPYITSGAVCGNWWQGTRMGTPEGYTVVSIRGGKLFTRYETYGFQSVDPHNT